MWDLSWVPTVPSFMVYQHTFFSQFSRSTWFCSLRLQHVFSSQKTHKFCLPIVNLQKLRLRVFWTSKSVYSFRTYGLAQWGCHDWMKKKDVFFWTIVFKKRLNCLEGQKKIVWKGVFDAWDCQESIEHDIKPLATTIFTEIDDLCKLP